MNQELVEQINEGKKTLHLIDLSIDLDKFYWSDISSTNEFTASINQFVFVQNKPQIIPK